MMEGHTSRSFDGALAALHMRVIEMGGLVLYQVCEASAQPRAPAANDRQGYDRSERRSAELARHD